MPNSTTAQWQLVHVTSLMATYIGNGSDVITGVHVLISELVVGLPAELQQSTQQILQPLMSTDSRNT